VQGGGSATVTQPGGSSNTYVVSSPDEFEAMTDPGTASITYQFQATYEFIWEPDEEAEGEDPPVSASLSVDYLAGLHYIENSSFYMDAASAGGEWSLSVTSPSGTSTAAWQAGMTSTPNYPDYHTINPTGTWGDITGQLGYTLSGMNPTVTVNYSGSLTTGGVSGGMLRLVAPPVGAPGGEGIWHLFPFKGRAYRVGRNMTANGRWRGLTGKSYKIECSYSGPYGRGAVLGLRGPAAGTGLAGSWSGYSFLMDVEGVWYSRAKLLRQNPSTGQYTDHVKTSSIEFRVTAAGDEP
jgi:hypothetical protein